MEKFSPEEIEAHLKSLNGWIYNGQALEKYFTFRNFNETFAFMTRIALIAEQLNHHPDWRGGYNQLTVELSSHDAGGITERDIRLASRIDAL